MKKEALWTIVIILVVIILAYFILSKEHPQTSEEITKCIGKNSVLYTQLGCHACKTQEEIFGENYKYLNVVDCFFEREKCAQEEISATPTWIIKEEKIIGAQSIEELRKLTECQ